MFDIVRNNKKVAQIILALIILPFAFWGVESYIGGMGRTDSVAEVGGSKISKTEFEQALREQQEQLRASLAGRDPALLDSPEVRQAVIDGLVQRRLLTRYADDAHILVSNEELARFIASVPQLQEGGKFSPERYESLLAAKGLNKSAFEFNLRQDMRIQQALQAVGNAAVAGKVAADRWLAKQLEEREISEAAIRPDLFLDRVKIAPDAVKAFYESNQKKFELPEQVRAEYVVLSRDKLANEVVIGDEEVKAWYQSHGDRYKQPETRRASHVLITVGAKASGDEIKAAEAKAGEVLAQAKAAGSDFGKLAKQHSQDPGSAATGGDLGWFGRGAMVKPFEDAVFALTDGQISGLVRSEFGFHVIKLTGVRSEQPRPFDEVKGEITAELRAQTAAKKYAEIAESFSNTVYEQSDSLKPAADKFGLAIKQSDWLTKTGGMGPLANPKLLSALFSDDALKNKRNTDAIEVAPNVLVAARVLEHKPAALQPIETVAPTIEKFLAHQEAVKIAASEGEQRLAQLGKGEKTDVVWGAARNVTRAAPMNLPPDAVKAIFKADTAKLPAFVGVATPAGYSLFKVSAVKPYVAGSEPAPQAEALRERYARALAEEETLAWITALKAKYPVEINRAVLESKEKPL